MKDYEKKLESLDELHVPPPKTMMQCGVLNLLELQLDIAGAVAHSDEEGTDCDECLAFYMFQAMIRGVVALIATRKTDLLWNIVKQMRNVLTDELLDRLEKMPTASDKKN